MRYSAVICSLALGVPALFAQTVDPGSGSPNDYIRNLFLNAYNRGQFPRLAALPPVGVVRRWGTTGLIQEFNDATRSSGRLALVKANSTADPENPTGDVYQVLTDLFTYYNSVGVTTAGYPLTDTQTCPQVACTWQVFDRRYVLVAYSSGANDTQNIFIRDPFYTRWDFFGGMSRMGPPVTAETAVTGFYGGNATAQTFQNGVIFNITSGTLVGRLLTVRAPIYTLYTQRGGHTGTLGYPTGDEQVLANGRRRQTFEGGSIEYDDTGIPVLRTPVNSILLRPATTPVRLNSGDTLTLEATVLATDGTTLTDRTVNWTTTNARVVTIQTSSAGLTATLRAIGGGTARVQATSEGRSSLPVELIVTAQCCAVGEGAPSPAIQQAFLDALARTRVQVRTPGPERVRRAGSGYVQEFQGTDAAGTRYLLTISDRSAQAYVVSGRLLVRYEELGGPAAFLGFPTSDVTASGRQLFEGGALAGNPVRVVAGALLARWAASGYEDGPAGMPAGDAQQATSFTGTSGQSQAFEGGLIAGSARAAYFIPEPAASAYSSLEGPLGTLGFPGAEEVVVSGVHRQEFEGGQLEYATGSTDVRVVTRERRASVTAVPSAVLPGGRLRITLAGFPDRASLRVTVTGQTDFVAPAPAGTFSWEFIVPANAAPATIRVRAVDTVSGASAETTYVIRTLAEARVQLVKISGDTQSGAPGAVLPNPLRVVLRDDAGNPVSGSTVRFTASPGATVSPVTAVTDAAGVAETRLRLPGADGIALVTAESARQVVTFSARAVGATILNFPRLTQTGTDTIGTGNVTLSDGGALLASAASVLRFHQSRGELGTPNGTASVTGLNEFLRRACVTDSTGMQVCDGFLNGPSGQPFPNLWRLPQYTGGGLEVVVESPEQNSINALVAAGSPVIIALALTADGVRGSHFVVATGLTAEGGISVHDPDPALARPSLSDYMTEFEVQGRRWTGEVAGVVRLVPRRTPVTGFLAWTTAAGMRLTSNAGPCGFELAVPGESVRTATAAGGTLRFRTCDATSQEFQLELDGEGAVRGTVLDLADGGARSELAGGGGVAFRIVRTAGRLLVTPQAASISAGAVLNSATFTPELAAGGLVSIFGSGLARTGRDSRVTVGGRAASVVAAFPFQLNVQIPMETPAGTHVVRVETPWGTAEQPVEIRAVAPAVFRAAGRGITVNQNGTLNSPSTPARRGETVVVYATGLGQVGGTGNIRPSVVPVTALLRGQEMRVAYAGLTPGFVGLYQINIVTSATVAPGLDVPLVLRQGGVDAQPVEISIF